jgi:hypothetical protein
MNIGDVVTLIGGSKPFLSDGSMDMYIGVITNEGASLSAEVASHAIEDGSTIQSHAKKSPETFSLSVRMGGAFSLSKALYNAVSNPKMPELTVAEKLEKLRKWQDDFQLVKYSGPKAPGLLYQTRSMLEENLIITNIEENRTNKSDAWDITLSFQRMRIVKAMMTTINLPVASQNPKGGGQTATGSDATTKTQSSTILKGLFK